MDSNPHAGLSALLTPENSVLLLIDHQAFQVANLHSHEPTLIINNVAGLAKSAKVYGVPTVLTTLLEQTGGHLIPEIQSVASGPEDDVAGSGRVDRALSGEGRDGWR